MSEPRVHHHTSQAITQPAGLEKVRLNLGCGNDYREGWVNLDLFSPKCDIRHDLSKFPYPFKDGSVDEIYASHIIEHLPDTFRVMEEFWRIMAPKGKLTVKVPHFSSSAAWTNLQHKRAYGINSMAHFDEQYWESTYTHARFKVKSAKLAYTRRKTLPLILLSIIPNAVAALNPYWADRLAPMLFGGYDEIIWELEAKK